MQRDKVSEKVIWENFNPREDSVSVPEPTVTSAAFVQPKMMFCWKCWKDIPSDSIFCPWCQMNLYATCPKCGIKYSSQYPNCNQCGTNRENYILEEKKNKIHKFREKILQRWTFDIYRCYHRNGLGECVEGEWYEDGEGRRITSIYCKVKYLHYGFTAELKGDKWGIGRFELDSNGNLIVREYADFIFDEVHQFEVAQRKDLFGEYCANVVRNGESLILGANSKLFRRK